MMTKSLYKSILIFLLLGSVNISFGQSDTLPGIHVVDYAKYKPKLAPANKLLTKPFIDEPKTLLPEFTYSIPQFRYRVNPVYNPASAIKLKAEKAEDLTSNYFRAGFGNYMTPLAEIHLHNGKNKNYNYGVHVKHFSSNNGKPADADFNDNLVGVYGNKIGSKGKLFGSLDYERNGFTYYGYNPDSFEFKKKDIKNAYNTFRGKTYWDNHSERKKMGLRFGFQFHYRSNGTTDELMLEGSNYTKFKMGKAQLSFNNAYEFLQVKNDSGTYGRHFIQIAPKYAFKYKKYFFEIGLNIIDVVDTGGENIFRPYPQLHFHHFIVPKKMKFYADIGGGVLKNSFDQLSTANPFLMESYNTKTGFENFSIKAGLQGIVVKKLDYHIGINYATNSNYAFFVNDTSSMRPFNVIYDGLNVMTLHTMLSFNHNEKWFIRLGGNFYDYTAKNERNPWQLPRFDAEASLSTLIAKKLRISFKAFAIGERIPRDPENILSDVPLGTILDLNIHSEYYYKPNMSFFLNVNNLMNQKYQYWNFYPQYGINVLVGITFSI